MYNADDLHQHFSAAAPSAPNLPIGVDEGSVPHAVMSASYPKLSTLNGVLMLDNSTKMLQQNVNALANRNNIRHQTALAPPRQHGTGGYGATSIGSSPLSSHSESSRSVTPKTDQTDADNSV